MLHFDNTKQELYNAKTDAKLTQMIYSYIIGPNSNN